MGRIESGVLEQGFELRMTFDEERSLNRFLEEIKRPAAMLTNDTEIVPAINRLPYGTSIELVVNVMSASSYEWEIALPESFKFVARAAEAFMEVTKTSSHKEKFAMQGRGYGIDDYDPPQKCCSFDFYGRPAESDHWYCVFWRGANRKRVNVQLMRWFDADQFYPCPSGNGIMIDDRIYNQPNSAELSAMITKIVKAIPTR